MTPIDTIVSTELQKHCAGCIGDARTEFLVLCSGLNGLHQHKLNQTHSNGPVSLPGSLPGPFSKNRLAVLIDYDHSDLPGNRRNGFQKQHSNSYSKRNFSRMSNEPHLVKVAIHTKAVNPYVVIYDSTQKYALPVAYLKLSNYSLIAGSGKQKEEDCTFRILPKRHEDLDNESVITFRARTSEKRDELVRYLNSLCEGFTKSAPLHEYVAGSSTLPTLLEENDEEDFSDETLKLTTPPKRRENRRNSLNSLGIRLRFNSNAFGRAR